MSDDSITIDITVIISLTAIAISIIFLYALYPSLANNETLNNIVEQIVMAIASLLGVVVGKNVWRSKS